MFAHRLLLTKNLSILSKKPLKILKQLNTTNDLSTSGHSYYSFKANSDDQTNVSLFNIKKSLKLANADTEDGFTNIKTLCPVCEPSKAGDIYINKTTGEQMS